MCEWSDLDLLRLNAMRARAADVGSETEEQQVITTRGYDDGSE